MRQSESGNGAFPSYAGARNDLAVAEAGGPNGGEAHTDLLGGVLPILNIFFIPLKYIDIKLNYDFVLYV
jgi:hypothetical protein